ncbi:PglZ domain-containing protein, partial [Vagococcus salmoninarum]
GTLNREKVLRGEVPESVAISYETVTENKVGKGLRELFNGQEVIYIYHDQIDRTGDHGQEHQVFDAVAKAIKELESLVRFISNGASIYRFIITADHGFIYRRKSVAESDKIDNPSTNKEQDRVERRFIISENNYQAHGIGAMSLGASLNNTDQRYVNYPLTTSIFKKAGGGQNYVHGGSTIQEMLAPVLEVNVSRGSAAKTTVDVELMSSRKKITGLSTVLEFYQRDQVNDSFMKGAYELYFESQDGQRVSNSHLYMADSKSDNSAERFSKFTFEFINRHYSVTDTYYLVVYNSETSVEYKRYEFVIDNPFAGNFSFDL